MSKEVERKYLIDITEIGSLENGAIIKQEYISTTDNTVVRIRISDEHAFLTLKGENNGITRLEFEYKIPLDDAEQIISQLCSGPIVEKTRYRVKHCKHCWEIDVFHGENEGLVVAEIELSEEDEAFEIPHWITTEVSDDERYYNSNLLLNPFKNW